MKTTLLGDRAVSPNLEARDTLTCAYPFAAAIPGGGVISVYRAGREKHSPDGRFLAQSSADGGRSWSDASVVFDGRDRDPPESVHAGVVCSTRDGELLAWFTTVESPREDVYVFSETGRALRQHLYVYRSGDRGRSWAFGAEHVVRDAPRNVYVGSRPLVLDDGRILLPLEATGPLGNQMVLCVFSDERGSTIGSALKALADESGKLSYGDPRVCRLPDGRISMLSWTFVTATERTIPVHASVSADQGQSWSPARSTGVESQIMSPLWVGGSVLLAVSTVREGRPGIRLWRSDDLGASWTTHAPVLLWSPKDERVVLEPLGAGKVEPATAAGAAPIWSALPSYTFGTPDLLDIGDAILHTYYASIGGITHVRACRLARPG